MGSAFLIKHSYASAGLWDDFQSSGPPPVIPAVRPTPPKGPPPAHLLEAVAGKQAVPEETAVDDKTAEAPLAFTMSGRIGRERRELWKEQQNSGLYKSHREFEQVVFGEKRRRGGIWNLKENITNH